MDPIERIEMFCAENRIFIDPFNFDQTWVFTNFIRLEDEKLGKRVIGIEYKYLVEQTEKVLNVLKEVFIDG